MIGPQLASLTITVTYLYNFDPHKPHFYIVKLGFTGVYIIFLISAQKAVLTSTYNLCFEQKKEKYQNFSSENFHFLVVKFSIYLNRRVFVMPRKRYTKAVFNFVSVFIALKGIPFRVCLFILLLVLVSCCGRITSPRTSLSSYLK